MASQLITTVRNLHLRKGRRRRGLTIAEGVRLVADALDARVPIRGVVTAAGFAGDARADALLRELGDRAVPIEEVPVRLFRELAGTDTPQGILAIVEQPASGFDRLRPGHGRPVLALDGVQDPGNVGTLIRTAFALGAAGVVLLAGSAELVNPKVVRGAMGATFRLPVVAAQPAELVAWARRAGVHLWAAAAAGLPVPRVKPPDLLALVVGNEGAGVRAAVRDACERQVSVPLARGAESLNVAVAAGILLHELIRGA